MTAVLVRNGIPYDVAECWPEDERMAYFIIFTEMETGRRYNFETREFEDRR